MNRERDDSTVVTSAVLFHCSHCLLFSQSMSSPPPLPHVLVAVTGSVATIKLEPLLDLLLPFCDVRVITSQRARHFFDVQRVKERVKVYQDEDEWQDWKRGDPVLHIEVCSNTHRTAADLLPLHSTDAALLCPALLSTLSVSGWFNGASTLG